MVTSQEGNRGEWIDRILDGLGQGAGQPYPSLGEEDREGDFVRHGEVDRVVPSEWS
jgi:hypothetical protein